MIRLVAVALAFIPGFGSCGHARYSIYAVNDGPVDVLVSVEDANQEIYDTGIYEVPAGSQGLTVNGFESLAGRVEVRSLEDCAVLGGGRFEAGRVLVTIHASGSISLQSDVDLSEMPSEELVRRERAGGCQRR